MKPPAPPEVKPAAQLEFHDLAKVFPVISDGELNKLATDIFENGLNEKIVLFQGKILDGRNRWIAAQRCSFALRDDHFRKFEGSDAQAKAFVISANIHRRHLSAEQRRDLIAELIKAEPAKSDRQIAEVTKTSHHTVGDVRSGLEATGQIAQLEQREGADGKKRKAKGKGNKKPKVPNTAKEYDALQEQLIDKLRELTLEHATDKAEKTKSRLDELEEELARTCCHRGPGDPDWRLR